MYATARIYVLAVTGTAQPFVRLAATHTHTLLRSHLVFVRVSTQFFFLLIFILRGVSLQSVRYLTMSSMSSLQFTQSNRTKSYILDQTPPNVFRTHKYCMHTAIRLYSSKPTKKKPILHRRIPSRGIHFQTGWEFMTSIRKSPTQTHGVPTADLSLPSLLQPRALLLPLPARLAR